MEQGVSSIRSWMAIYTNPRSEKKVAERLLRKGVEAYCPVYTTIRQWSDRKKKVQLPLINSYVFVNCSELERLLILKDPGVRNFVFWLGKPAIIRTEEIIALKQFTGENVCESIEFQQFENQSEVLVQSGVFRGEAGIILQQASGTVSVLLKGLGAILKIKTSEVKLANGKR